MSLKQNQQWLSQYPVRFLAGATSKDRAIWNTGADKRDLAFCVGSSWKKVSGVPYSYPPPYCWILPIRSGGVRASSAGSGQVTYANLAGVKWGVCTMAGTTTFTASPKGIGRITVTISGSGGATATAGMAAFATATIAGTGNVIASLGAIADLICNFAGQCVVEGEMRADAFVLADIYVNESTATVQQMANAVLDAKTADHNQSGSIGRAIAAAGSAGDPWITPLPGAYGAGTAGDILGNLSVGAGGLTPEEHEMLVTTIPDSLELIDIAIGEIPTPPTPPTASAIADAVWTWITGTRTVSIGTGGIVAATLAADAITKIQQGLALDVSLEAIPDAVWNTAVPGAFPTGSAGKTLAASGSSSDPWLAELPGTYPAGTAGDIVGKKLLRTSKYLGLQE